MKNTYAVTLNLERDSWNWYDASQTSSHGFDWRNNIDNKTDLDIYDQIALLDEKKA